MQPGDSVRPLRVCYFGTYRAEYSRNRIMIAGLRQNGVEVIECQAALWSGLDDRVETATGGWARPGFWLRLLQVYRELLRKHAQIGEYDVLVTGYPGQLDVFLARLLAWWRGKPLAWDVFMSIYLIAVERNLHRRSGLSTRLLRLLEKIALRLPDVLIHDTAEYVAWLSQTHGVDPGRFRLVPTGAEDEIYRPAEDKPVQNQPLRVVYFGTYIRNHGVPVMVAAAARLGDLPNLHFEFIGQGPERPAAEALARENNLTNFTFIDWLEPDELARRAAQADICLGAFGDTPQSLMTVQNKIYAALAMALPLVTGDSPTMRRSFNDGEHLLLTPRLDPEALAAALRRLATDPALRQKLAHNGRALFVERYTVRQLGAVYAEHLQELVQRRGGQGT